VKEFDLLVNGIYSFAEFLYLLTDIFKSNFHGGSIDNIFMLAQEKILWFLSQQDFFFSISLY
jgi:hypothetical protein